MIKAEQIQEILLQYKKHGWNLRRVLLCGETRKKLADSLMDIFGEVEISEGKIDAVWFSRPAKNEREAWELRHLSEVPFALFESFGNDETEDVRIQTQKELETRLEDQASRIKQ